MDTAPRLALKAISLTTGMGMNKMVEKPMLSVARAIMPGAKSFSKLAWEATRASWFWAHSKRKELIFWMAWLTAIAKTRNTITTDIGSRPNPTIFMEPNNQLNDKSAQPSAVKVNDLDRV